jgi:hypothetical protein
MPAARTNQSLKLRPGRWLAEHGGRQRSLSNGDQPRQIFLLEYQKWTNWDDGENSEWKLRQKHFESGGSRQSESSCKAGYQYRDFLDMVFWKSCSSENFQIWHHFLICVSTVDWTDWHSAPGGFSNLICVMLPMVTWDAGSTGNSHVLHYVLIYVTAAHSDDWRPAALCHGHRFLSLTESPQWSSDCCQHRGPNSNKILVITEFG